MPNYMTELSPDNNANVYQVKDKEAAPIDLLKDTVGWSGKNEFKLPSNVSSTTVGGVTFTVTRNSDGQIESIKANGTNTSGDNVIFQLGEFNLDGINDFIVSGTPDTSQNYGLRVGVRTSESDDFGNTFLFTEKGVEQTIPANTSAPYGVYVCIIIYQGKSPSNVLFKPMIRKASVIDATYEPYHESVKQTLRDAEVIEGKNLFNIPENIVSQTKSGVTFTVNRNSDGEVTSIVANGTATADASFVLFYASDTYDFLNKRVILSGCPSGGSNATYFINGYRMASKSGESGSSVEDTGNGVEFDSLNDGSGVVGYIAVVVKPNYTANNLVFKPMLRDASENDLTFEPHYIPLKDSKFNRAEQRVLGAKNLLPNTAKTQTINGVTFTVNADGSVTANGTASADAVLWLTPSTIQDQIPKNVGIILSGCPQSGSATTYYLSTRIGLLPNDSYVRNDVDSGNGVNLQITEQNTIKCSANIKSGQTVSNLTFKPMLRLTSDPDDTYVPYAMTNRELTTPIMSEVTDIVEGASISSDVGNTLWKIGRQVYLSIGLASLTATSLSTNIFKIPQGFRPPKNIFVAGNQCAVRIDTSGNVRTTSNLSNSFFQIATSWITDE